MADNVEAPAGSGGATFASDDIGGVQFPRVKLIHGADGTNDGDVSNTNPLPIDDAGGSLTVDNGGTFVVQEDGAALTALQAIQAAVEGTLTVGSHAVTNAGTFVVQEDGAALTALQLIDDAVYTDATGTPSKGIAVMGTDGTNPQLISVDTSGNVQVDIVADAAGLATETTVDAIKTAVEGTLTVGSHAVTNAGTFVVQEDGAALTALQLIDDVIFADDAAFTPGTSKVAAIGAILDDTATDSVDEGDVGALRMTARRALYTTFETPAGDSPWDDTNDALQVNVVAGGGSGGTSATDDGAFTAGSGSGTPAMGFFSADTVDANDVGVLAMDASRRLLVSIEVDNVGIGGGTQYTEDDAAPANPVGNALLAERDDALGGLTPIEGDWSHLFCDANGALWTAVNNTVTVDASGTAVPVTDNGGALTVDWAGTAPPIGAGTEAAALRVTLATDSTGVVSVDDNGAALTVDNAGTFATQVDGDALTALQLLDNIVVVEDATHNTGDSGVMALAVRNDALAALAGTDGDYAPLQVSALGAVFATLAPETTGGLTVSRNIDVDETEDEIKGAAGQLYTLEAWNAASSAMFLHFYNATAASVTVGTTAPDWTFRIPDDSGLTLSWPQGLAFGTAITVAATTTVGGSSGPAANEVGINLGYK